MNGSSQKDMAENVVIFIAKFLNKLPEEDKRLLPPILRNSKLSWVLIYDESMIGAICVDRNKQFPQIVTDKQKGLPPFPGFIISEHKKPPDALVAFSMAGSCNFFSSNHVSNAFSFSVSPKASFTIDNHFYEIKDPSGQEFKYHIELAFVLGIEQGEQWPSIESRLNDLLNHSMGVWRKLNDRS